MKKKICGIYKITCLTNGKAYIGLSKDIHARWYQHKYYLAKYSNYSQRGLKEDVNLYGWDNFNFEVIEECPPENLKEREKFHILENETFESELGYNRKTKALLQMKGDKNEQRRT